MIDRLKNLTSAHVWLLSLFISAVMTEAVAAGLGILLNGNVTYNYFLVGLVASLVIGSLAAVFLNYFLDQQRKIESDQRAEATVFKVQKSMVVADPALKGEAEKNNQHITAVRDSTESKVAEEQILNLAFYDRLTQLPNRRLLKDRLEQTMAGSKRSGRYGALMLLDLDNFKALNDLHGNGAGDLLLIEAARRISSCVREMDTVARFGGDEFVVMLSQLYVDKAESSLEASIVAEKIRAFLAEPYLLTIQQEGKTEHTIEYQCTSSIGVVVFVNHEASREDLLKWAGKAMGQAKEDGQNLIRYWHQTDMMEVRGNISAGNEHADLKQAINNLDSLPAMPVIAQRLLALKLDTDEGERMLLVLIEQDPQISAKILGLSNSAMVGASRKIKTVKDAAMLLGTKRVQSVAAGIAIISLMSKARAGKFNMQELWLHSFGIAFAMQGIARLMPVNMRPQDDQIFLAGLLHDIGYLALAFLDPKQSDKLHTRLAAEADRPSLEVERELLEICHDELGAELARHWNLPEEIIAVLQYHHDPDAAGADAGQPLVRMVNIVEKLLPSFGINEYVAPDINAEEWDALGIPQTKAEEAKALVDEQAEQAIQLTSLFA